MQHPKKFQFYEFEPFRLSVNEGLLCDGQPLLLTPKALETLLVLVENRGQIVLREELMGRVWSDCYVEENCLTKNISTLRKILGEATGGERHFIETVPRRGYRFIADVSEICEMATEKIAGTLAVLPFKVFGSPAEVEYLGVGMADVLITRLSNLREIAVRPTSAVRKYEHTQLDAVAIGRKLRVDWILEGSFFKINEQRVRVTIQFIGVREKRPLWGERLDEESTDLIGIQDSIAEKVTQMLVTNLGIAAATPKKTSTADNAAFKEYLEGRFYWSKRTTDGMQKAVECFRRAIDIDPNFALGHAGLGDAYLLHSQHSLLKPADCLPLAKNAALTAIKIDPHLSEPHATLAHIAFLYEWNGRRAESYYRRAIELNPNYAVAHHWYALFLRSMGRFETAVSELQTALELDPLSPIMLKNLGAILVNCKEFAEAERVTRKAIELEPNFALARQTLGWIYLRRKKYELAIEQLERAVHLSKRNPSVLTTLGCVYAAAQRIADARQILRELDHISRRVHFPKYEVAQIFIYLGDYDKVFELLEQALNERDFSLVLLAVDPDFDPLRSDPRFSRLWRQINFAV